MLLLALGLCAAWPFRRQAPPPAKPPPALAVDLPHRGRDVTLEPSPPGAVSPAAGLEELSPLERRDIRPVSLTESRPDLAKIVPPPAMPLVFGEGPRTPYQPPPPPPRRYRLRDGDTLESIAERYLGSRERAEELYALNREVLSRPDLLPVGTTIQVPQRDR